MVCNRIASMRMRMLTLVCAWLVWTLVAASGALAQATPPDDTPTPAPATTCADQDAACPDAQQPVAPPEVAGVQSSADDAREPGESEPFIINDGFGD